MADGQEPLDGEGAHEEDAEVLSSHVQPVPQLAPARHVQRVHQPRVLQLVEHVQRQVAEVRQRQAGQVHRRRVARAHALRGPEERGDDVADQPHDVPDGRDVLVDQHGVGGVVLDDDDDVADAADVVVRLLVVRRAADGYGGGVHDLEEVG